MCNQSQTLQPYPTSQMQSNVTNHPFQIQYPKPTIYSLPHQTHHI
jgi:hypothetical protein